MEAARKYKIFKPGFLESLSDDERFALDLLGTSKFFEDEEKARKKQQRQDELRVKFGDIEIWDEDDDEQESYLEEARERDRKDRR